VVLRTTRKSALIAAIAYLTWPALIAPVLAPVVGGYLTTFLSWHWIFLLNVPLGIAGIVLSLRLVPGMRSTEPGRLDWKGFLLTAVGVAALVIGLEQIGTGRANWTVVVVALGIAALTLAGAVGYLLRSPAPLIDLRTLRISSLRASVAGGTVYRLVITAIPFLLPLYYQLEFGWTAAQAGTILIALFAGNLGIKPLTTPLMRRWGIRTVLLVSASLGGACLVGMAFFVPGTPVALMVVVLALSGIFRSIGFSAYNALAFADVPHESMTQANTLNATVQGLAAGLGIAVGALLVRVGEPLSGALGLSGGAGPAYQVAFVLLAVMMVAPVVEAALLPRAAGSAVTGR
jgi:MFS family permease